MTFSNLSDVKVHRVVGWGSGEQAIPVLKMNAPSSRT